MLLPKKNDKFALHLKNLIMNIGELVPILGILTGIIVTIAVFLWLYHENKNKYAAVIEISKNLDDPLKAEELLKIFEERKKGPLDYRRSGVITLFVGLGIYLVGYISFGRLFEAAGALVALIGAGQIIAGYLYPNTAVSYTHLTLPTKA